MRVAVTGGRAYADQARVDEALDSVGVTLLIHGAASGADSLAADWATRRGIPVEARPADWDNIDARPCRIGVRNGKPYNKLAGFTRNLEMIAAQPDLVVAFPGGRGTEHMRGNALKAGIPVLDVNP